MLNRITFRPRLLQTRATVCLMPSAQHTLTKQVESTLCSCQRDILRFSATCSHCSCQVRSARGQHYRKLFPRCWSSPHVIWCKPAF